VSFPAGTAEEAIYLRPGLATERRSHSPLRARRLRDLVADEAASIRTSSHHCAAQRRATWNPRSSAQIAWPEDAPESRRYTRWTRMRQCAGLTDSGYASALMVAQRTVSDFSWNRKYGPGDPGGQDIYVMDIASRQWLQVTTNRAATTTPLGAGRAAHRLRAGHWQTRRYLVDAGRRHEQHQLTQTGKTSCPTELEVGP